MTTERARHTYLGGPDLAAIVGASRYAGPYDVFLRKTQALEIPDNAAMEWGRRLEGTVAQAYADRTGNGLAQGATLFHPDHDFLGGTPDFLVGNDPNLGLECKTSTEEALRLVDEAGEPLWGPEGTDQVPMDYFVQCQWYMGLTGRRRWDLAVFFMGPRREFRVYPLAFDRDLFDMLVERAVAFWHENVLPQVPPAIDLMPSDLVKAHLLGKAQAAGRSVDAPPALHALCMDWEDLSRRRLELEEAEKEIKGRLMEAMAPLGAQKLQGQAEGAKWSVAVQGGGVGEPVTDYRGIALHYAKQLGLPGIAPEVEADFTRPGKAKTPYLMPYFTAVRNARKKASAQPAQNIA